MPVLRYKIWAWGGVDSSAGGVSDQYLVGIQTRAKKGTEETSIYTVPNELICCQLGQVLGLPVPTGVVIERNEEAYYASLDFNIEGHNLPPADTAALARDQPFLVCGILAFDAWVVNPDRHSRNLSYSALTSRVYLFDHGHAFL